VRLFEGRAVGIPMGAEDAYQLTAAAVAAAWGPRTQGVLLASPSNPTGTLVSPIELHAIADECAARRAVCIVDEIYGELVYDGAPATVLAHTDDAFVVNSFSKTWGMTGWRLGWLVCPEWAVDAVERLEQNLYISAPTVAQEAALACFTPEVWAEVERRRLEFNRRRDVLVDGLRSLGAGVPVVPGGAFYVYADISRFSPSSTAWARRALDEAGVACTPGTDFGTYRAESHVRFSYTAPLARIEAALGRLAPLFA
jgi:aspartate/methionine/tyrosine aminotransferase